VPQRARLLYGVFTADAAATTNTDTEAHRPNYISHGTRTVAKSHGESETEAQCANSSTHDKRTVAEARGRFVSYCFIVPNSSYFFCR
jgi:hypothetical protein